MEVVVFLTLYYLKMSKKNHKSLDNIPEIFQNTPV